MIRSWKNKNSQLLWEQQKASAFRGLDHNAAIDLLLALNVARHLGDLRPLRSASLQRHKKRRKRWTMMVSSNWHIRFDFKKGGAHNVKIVSKSKG